MSMQRTIAVVTQLAAKGVIKNYALTGAVAALTYIEPTYTEDLDVLVSLDTFELRGGTGLILLGPIEEALAEMGYSERRDVGVVVEGSPVQFIPVASPLDEEALAEAVDVLIHGASPFSVRVLRAEHLVAKALSVGRLKDLARIEAFLDQDAVRLDLLAAVLGRHGLTPAWRAFCLKADRTDPLQ